MTTLTLLTPDYVEIELGGVVAVAVVVDDDSRPVFRVAGARALAPFKAGVGTWSATWVAEAEGDYTITITAGDADPLVVEVSAYDGADPSTPLNELDLELAGLITLPSLSRSAVEQAAVNAAAAALSTAPVATISRAAKAAGQSAHARALGTARQIVPVTISAINPQSSGVSLLETALGTLTYTNATTTFATAGAAAHGLVVGDKVRFLNGSKTGMQYLNGSTYYVRSVPSASTFLVAAAAGGGSSPDFGGDGTVPGLKTGYQNYSPWKKATQTLTITAANDTFTVPLAHFLVVGDAITVGSSTAGGVTSDTTYYVRTVPTSTSFTVSATVRGTTLDVTSDGTGALGQLNPVYAVTGWRPTQKSAFSPADIYTQPDPNVTTPTPGTVTTGSATYPLIIDGVDRFEVAFFNDNSHEAYVLVDGVVAEMVTTAQLTTAGNGSGQTGTKLYVLPDTGRHLVSVRHQGAFAGINVPSTARVSRYINPNRGAFWMFVGDSFTEGTGSAGVYYSLVAWAQRMLNIDNVWQAGSGGSGYSAAGVRAALVTRYQNDVINQAPDEIVIAMGLNDPRSTLTQINDTVTKATTVWDAIATQLPNANLRIVGPFSPKGLNATTGTDYRDASLVALDLALQVAATARGLRYISPIQEGWITGNGRVGTTTGNGNADVYITTDGTHPSPAGHEYLAWRIAGHLATPA